MSRADTRKSGQTLPHDQSHAFADNQIKVGSVNLLENNDQEMGSQRSGQAYTDQELRINELLEQLEIQIRVN